MTSAESALGARVRDFAPCASGAMAIEAWAQHAPFGIVVYDRELRVERVNTAFAALSGRRAAHHLGRTLEESTPELAAAWRPALERVIATGVPVVDLVVRGARRDAGAGRAWCATLYPVRAGAEIVGAAALVADEAVRASKARALERLARGAASLASSLDAGALVTQAIDALVPALGDACFVALAEADGGLRVVAARHLQRSTDDVLARVVGEPLGEGSIADRVVRAGRGEILPVEPAGVASVFGSAAIAARLAATDLRSLLVVPILGAGHAVAAPESARRAPSPSAGGAALGCVVIAGSGRAMPTWALSIATDFAHRLGAALENARLYEEAERERARYRFLAEAAQILSGTRDSRQTVARLLRLAVPVIGECALIFERDGDDLRMLDLAHADPSVEPSVAEAIDRGADELLSAIEHAGGVATATSCGEVAVVSVDDLEEAGAPAAIAARLRSLDLVAAIVVPLVASGRTLGALAAFSGRGAPPSARDLQRTGDLASVAAVALEQARLFEAADRERQRAEDASHSKDAFLGVVSHELRNPLSAVLGWSTLLAAGASDPERVRRAVAVIERNTRALARAVDDLLDVTRATNGRLEIRREPIALAPQVASVVEGLRVTAVEKGIELVERVEPCGTIDADASRIGQVVTNLVGNALKFTPRGGRITVSLAHRERAAILTVEDTGEGMSAELLPHVFDAFRQGDPSTTRSRGGLGLGLAIVRSIVAAHDGTVRAESDGVGRGSRFVVELPARAAGGARAAVIEASAEIASPRAAVLRGARVLVVDDEPDAREVLELALGSAGARVLTAGDVAGALDALDRERPDVVVSDVAMPLRDGYDLARSVRARPVSEGGATPLLALSALARREDRERALLAGFDAYECKPVDVAVLIRRVGEMLDAQGRVPAPPARASAL